MPNSDDLSDAVEAIHAAGLDTGLWPQALDAITRLCGGGGATFEVIHKPTQRHTTFYAVGLPTTAGRDYREHWASINPRINHGMRQKTGEFGWDYQFIDETAMDRDPFYADFLQHETPFRYFISAILSNTADENAVLAVQRTRRQGHVGAAEIALMRTLGPHLQGAHEVARRLKDASEARRSLEGALAWLADGVALVRADGTVVYANDALQASARRGDGVRIKRSQIELDAPAAQARLTDAIAAARERIGGDPTPACDFPAPRRSGAPAYLVSVRPLGKVRRPDGAAAIVFIRDPLAGHGATPQLLRGMFSLTAAEANLAQAIRAGMSLADYARAGAVTVNTVYTHLRRLKDKTGCHRMAELIRKLNDVQAAAVARRER